MKTRTSLISIFVLVVALAGCGERPDATEATPETTNPAPAAATDTGAVAFEPAYPEEVSTETLSGDDAAQQTVHQHTDRDAHAHETETEADHGHPH